MVRGIHNNNPYLQNIAMSEELAKVSKEKLEKKPRVDPSAYTDKYSPMGNKVEAPDPSGEEGKTLDEAPGKPAQTSESDEMEETKPSKGTPSTGSRIDIRI
jgi:hypothetical protein